MSTVAQTATLAWGYTMADVDRFARSASRIKRIIDSEDAYASAWHRIVVELLDPESETNQSRERPTPNQLIRFGIWAIGEAWNEYRQTRGIDRLTREPGPRFITYWAPRNTEDFTDKIAERLTLPALLSVLTDNEYAALADLAIYGSVAMAARATGQNQNTLNTRISRGRAKIMRAWFAPENPPRRTPQAELHITCHHGHSRAEHGYRDNTGMLVCRVCRRNSIRRARARMTRGGATAQRAVEDDNSGAADPEVDDTAA